MTEKIQTAGIQGQLVNEIGCQTGLRGSSAKHPGSWRRSAGQKKEPHKGLTLGDLLACPRKQRKPRMKSSGQRGEACRVRSAAGRKPWAGNSEPERLRPWMNSKRKAKAWPQRPAGHTKGPGLYSMQHVNRRKS